MFGRLHHVAYRCKDAQRTVDFYTKVIGLKYVAGLMPPENNKPTWPLNEPGQPARKVVGEEADRRANQEQSHGLSRRQSPYPNSGPGS